AEFCLRSNERRESFVLAASTRDPFRFGEPGAGRSVAPYLALHPMGFSVPPRLRLERWALTPPFHPYRHFLRNAGGIFSVALSVGPPRSVASRVYPRMLRVTRHRALWCSDFPPPPNFFEGSDSPPFQNQDDYKCGVR